jgi:hypothetical protein
MQYLTVNYRSIFLIDGIGAIFSALFTGLILPCWIDETGLPLRLVYALTLFPVVYGVYSLCCFYLPRQIKPWMLLTIIIANLFYCAVSTALIVGLGSMTLLGKALLATEILVILGVVALETYVYWMHYR